MRYRMMLSQGRGGDGFTPRTRETREVIVDLPAPPEVGKIFTTATNVRIRGPWLIDAYQVLS